MSSKYYPYYVSRFNQGKYFYFVLFENIDTQCFSFGSLQDFASTFYLQLFWIDSRLSFDGERYITLTGTDMEKFWLPDIHFLYEKKSHHHNVIQANKRMIINHDGTCEYSVR